MTPNVNETPTDELTIRPATVDDAALVLSLIQELAHYERLASEVVATEAMLRETLFGERPAAEVLIAEEGGAAVGFALFFHNYSTFLGRAGIHLEDLYVRQSHRGRGYGRALLRRVAEIAQGRECGRLEWSVLDWNEPAIRFYEKLGAVAMDDWTIYRVTGPTLARLADG